MRISDFQIHDRKKLDEILVRLCELVIDGQRKDPDAYMMCAASVLDSNNNCVAALNYWTKSGDVHAERAAIDAYHKRFGKIPNGSIIITTCSPCTQPMQDRIGSDCQDMISHTNIHKVYAGFRDPSQQTHNQNKTYHLEITANPKIQALCKLFADSWLKDKLGENFADGKGPGRPGDSQRHGISKGASMTELEKASHSKGRKGQLARWQLNMRRGHKK